MAGLDGISLDRSRRPKRLAPGIVDQQNVGASGRVRIAYYLIPIYR